jgi:lipopolysaccharide exporter
MTAPATATLRQRAVRSAAWSVPTSIGSRAVGLLGTLLLARYLAPGEYGVVMAASIAATTATTVTTFGVGMYLVANPGMSRAETFHASCWFLATGAAVLIVTLLLGDPLERWLGAPGLVHFLPMLIVAMLLERIVYVPERILVRNLRFGWLSLARGAGELTYTAATVLLAAAGAGAMAIAWGSLARSAVRFAAIVPAVHVREWLEPHRLQLRTLVRMVAYGMNFTVASVATFGMRRWDNLLISRYFGPGVMGAYNYAYNLADTPATAVGDQMSDIIAASFPHVDRAGRARALVHACTLVAMIMMPLSIGLAVVAQTVIDTFFDSRWSSVGPMLTCLSVLAVARPLCNILGAYFYASGRPSTVLWLEWASLIVLVAALATLGRISVNWSCVCVGAVFVLRTLAAMWVVRRQDGVRLARFLAPMTGPLAAGVAMAAGVGAARFAAGEVTPALRLAIEIATGAAIYVGAVLVVAPAGCAELLRAVGSALSGSATGSSPAPTDPDAIPRVLSVSTEFPNPTEPGKGLFVRSRLAAIAARASMLPVLVVAPVALLDYANPRGDLLAAQRIPRQRHEGSIQVLHPRWLYPPRGGWMNAWFLFARLLPLALRLRARRRFDVIDAHFAHPEGIAAVLLGRTLGLPVVVTIRGSELRYRHQPSKRWWMSWALRRADRVIAVSDGLRALAIDLGVDPRRVRTVPNGIDTGTFARRDRRRCRARHGLPLDAPTVLSAGDLAELKGHHRVIAAVEALNERGLGARLLIAGGVGRSGRYADTLREQVGSAGLTGRVVFLGEVTQPTLAELMCAADVFCLASSSEGWPNVVNEALACGTPVVATDVGAVRQMIDSDRAGFVVPVHDDRALAEALSEALTRDWDHEAISAWGRSRSWDQVAGEVVEEMRAVVTDRRASPQAADASPARTRVEFADSLSNSTPMGRS